MTEQKHDDACGASRSDAWLEGPMWETFGYRYSPGNPARPEDLEIFPKLKDEPGQSRFAVSISRGAGAGFALAAKRGTGQGAKTTAGGAYSGCSLDPAVGYALALAGLRTG